MTAFLVIQLARFGDLLQTRRLVRTLQSRPGAEVHLCLDASLVPVARRIYPEAALHPIAAHASGLPPAQAAAAVLGGNRTAFAELAGLPFEEIYNCNVSGLSLRVAGLFDPERVRGHVWKNGQEIRGAWAAMAMRWTADRRLGLNIADFWAHLSPDPVRPEAVNPEAKPRGGGLGVALAGRESRRSLPPAVLAPLVRQAWEQGGRGRIVLLGSASEARAGHELLRLLPAAAAGACENLAGKTGYADLMEAVAGLDLLLTPDTGTMHLAAALGVPTRAFFLSSAWAFETGPYGLGHVVVQGDLDCLPCLESRLCPRNLDCLRSFADQGLVRGLSTGKAGHFPAGLLVLRSAFDGLGLTFEVMAGEDRQAARREEFRRFLLKFLDPERGAGLAPAPDQAARLFAEKQWMAGGPR